MSKYFLLLFSLIVFSNCKKDDSLQDLIIGEWDATNYYAYYYSECPEPKEHSKNSTDLSTSATIYKKIVLLKGEDARLIWNHTSNGVKEEEHRGKYTIKNDSISFHVKEVYFDGVKQTISDNLYVDPELKNVLPYDYLLGRSSHFKFSYNNDKLDIYQMDYDRDAGAEWIDEFGVKHRQLGRTARTEKVTYQRK